MFVCGIYNKTYDTKLAGSREEWKRSSFFADSIHLEKDYE